MAESTLRLLRSAHQLPFAFSGPLESVELTSEFDQQFFAADAASFLIGEGFSIWLCADRGMI